MHNAARVIDTYILDSLNSGLCAGIPVTLEAAREDGSWELLGEGVTDAEGWSGDLSGRAGVSGSLRFTYDVSAFWERLETPAVFPQVVVAFEAEPSDEDFSLVLLLGPYGYTTYRGN